MKLFGAHDMYDQRKREFLLVSNFLLTSVTKDNELSSFLKEHSIYKALNVTINIKCLGLNKFRENAIGMLL